MAKGNETSSLSTNMITSGTTITGDIQCDSDIRIEGTLQGNLVVKGKVVIGSSGVITGEISCQNCDIEGSLDGKIVTKELLSLRSTAKVLGDIYTSKIAIEPGAVFTGLCNMNNGADAKISHSGSPKKVELVGKKAL